MKSLHLPTFSSTFPPCPAARYYHSTLSIWLSVDPMSDKYPSTSPYTYCGNNPVRLVDPDGREIWKPDLEGNLIAERGDNAWTLAKFLNDTPEKAIAMLKSQGYKINNGILNLKIGDKVKLDNVFTRSIASPSNTENDSYNCWGSAYAGVQDKTLNREIGIPYPAEFDNILTEQFESVPLSEAQFGKTIIRFEYENPYQGTKYDNLVQKGLASRQSGMIGSTSHAAVYYGKSNDGTIYVFTKNGYNSRKPMVVPLKSLLGPEGYGKVTGIGGESGYYNLKN